MKALPAPTRHQGFTLAEVATVMVIVALVLGGFMMSLPTQLEQQRTRATDDTLEEAREALLGFAIANGRLPCPASATSNGQESFCSNAVGGCGAATTILPIHGRCTNPFNGFLPAVALGISNTDGSGYATDGSSNLPAHRLRYAVATQFDITTNTYTFTAPGGMRSIVRSATGFAGLNPNLNVCSTAVGVTPTNCAIAPAPTAIAEALPAIIYTPGANAVSGGTGPDEAANPNPNSPNNDAVFVWHNRQSQDTTLPGGPFDDQMVWLSAPLLYNRLVTAGQLP
ncbi:type II secretion system protein [Chitinimonas sp. JJ19]|uniref:type II secretion system protein n=1 Tax=Chitinimonas sp. JJ19 TaxID=3109352 RepID=UPI003001EE1D